MSPRTLARRRLRLARAPVVLAVLLATSNVANAHQLFASGFFAIPAAPEEAELLGCGFSIPLSWEWIHMPGFDGHTAVLTMDLTLDADLYFYDAACQRISSACAQKFLGETEVCTVADGTTWGLVIDFAGLGNWQLFVFD